MQNPEQANCFEAMEGFKAVEYLPTDQFESNLSAINGTSQRSTFEKTTVENDSKPKQVDIGSARSLQKIHTYVAAQPDQSKIHHFFRQGELSTLLKACNTGLQEALDGFKLQLLHTLNQ
ncbi:hypothetical protein C8R43DRAFT_948262 [Mycena crocata]|nr:hypothetical protein C8R43DRAFT_948262 [Mycena crocata]